MNAIARAVISVADEIGATPAQVATAWVRQQPWQVIRSSAHAWEAQMVENLAALDVELSSEQVERLSDASGFRVGFPARLRSRAITSAGSSSATRSASSTITATK